MVNVQCQSSQFWIEEYQLKHSSLSFFSLDGKIYPNSFYPMIHIITKKAKKSGEVTAMTYIALKGLALELLELLIFEESW